MDRGTELSLFANPSTAPGRNADRLGRVARELLERLARELARDAGPDGICVDDLRIAATRRGLITGEETGRRLSYLGGLMKSAGLRGTAQYRRSKIERSHGNLNKIWVSPEHAAAFGGER